MAGTTGCDPARGSGSLKAGPSSDRRLQPACAKPELLVIADQHAAVNTFRALYTPPVTPPESSAPEAAGRTPLGAEASKVWRVRGVKS